MLQEQAVPFRGGNASMQQRTVIIADDHPMVRSALRESLRHCLPTADIHECASFNEASETLTRLAGDVDLLLIDLDMPGMQGFVGLLTVQATWPAVPAVMVSATQDQGTVERARQCGALGFIPKSAPMERICDAVLRILDGQTWFPEAEDQPLGGGEDATQLARRLASLTAQQMRVLHMIVEGKLNKQIAGDMNLAEQTVKGHVSSILRKLGVYRRTQVVLAVGPLLSKPMVRH